MPIVIRRWILRRWTVMTFMAALHRSCHLLGCLADRWTRAVSAGVIYHRQDHIYKAADRTWGNIPTAPTATSLTWRATATPFTTTPEALSATHSTCNVHTNPCRHPFESRSRPPLRSLCNNDFLNLYLREPLGGLLCNLVLMHHLSPLCRLAIGRWLMKLRKGHPEKGRNVKMNLNAYGRANPLSTVTKLRHSRLTSLKNPRAHSSVLRLGFWHLLEQMRLR